MIPIKQLRATAYKLPTATPEADGTATWTSTTLVLVEVIAGGVIGIGYTYAERAAGMLINDVLAPALLGMHALDLPALRQLALIKLRNLGSGGVTAMAAAAVDNALWDLKAKLLQMPLAGLLGQSKEHVDAYGSGGFTSYSEPELVEHMLRWAEQGYHMVKMKVGQHPDHDVQRAVAVRRALGQKTQLFIDANGAYSAKQAIKIGEQMTAEADVCWFEEPVWHTDFAGLRTVREHAPGSIEVAAGEYGFEQPYFFHMLKEQAVDVLQIDATRCGISGFLEAAALSQTYHIDLSSHCAPSLHVALGVATERMRHIECFFDHMRLERLLFDGAVEPHDGRAAPDLSRPGLGLEFKHQDAKKFAW